MRSKSAWPACDVCAVEQGFDPTGIGMDVGTLCPKHRAEYEASVARHFAEEI